MAELPNYRLQLAFPTFAPAGVDYFGPFNGSSTLQWSNMQGLPVYVHDEGGSSWGLLMDLSTDAMMKAIVVLLHEEAQWSTPTQITAPIWSELKEGSVKLLTPGIRTRFTNFCGRATSSRDSIRRPHAIYVLIMGANDSKCPLYHLSPTTVFLLMLNEKHFC